MGYKISNQNNNDENIFFSNNTLLNFIFAIGFFNLLYISLFGLEPLTVLSNFYYTLFIFTCTCSIIFIYFLFKILFFEIFSKKNDQIIE